jgi:predicted O-methyltransferase YrrM
MNKSLFTGNYVAFSPFDRLALEELIRAIAKPNCRMAEIGSWLGNGSTQVFYETLAPTNGNLLCVDTWRGNQNVQRHQEIVAKFDVLGTFRANIEAANSPVKVQALISDSLSAAPLIADNSLDLLFIDADHSYDAVRSDIEAWRRKVRPGGILCGHDCEARPTLQNKDRLIAARDLDSIDGDGTPFKAIHPGSILAVDEAFEGGAKLWAEKALVLPDGQPGRSTIWWWDVIGNQTP